MVLDPIDRVLRDENYFSDVSGKRARAANKQFGNGAIDNPKMSSEMQRDYTPEEAKDAINGYELQQAAAQRAPGLHTHGLFGGPKRGGMPIAVPEAEDRLRGGRRNGG